jgi:hypothetical protein
MVIGHEHSFLRLGNNLIAVTDWVARMPELDMSDMIDVGTVRRFRQHMFDHKIDSISI